MEIIKKLVSKFTKGRNGKKPFLVVIHIAVGTKEQVYSTFKYEEKSSHYLVNRDGSVWQFVDEKDTAWTQGIVNKPSSEMVVRYLSANPNANINEICISIEHEGYSLINDIQYQTSAKLIRDICERNNIPIDNKHIIGHRQIAAYKRCPDLIDIERLIHLAFSKPPETIQPPVAPSLIPAFLKRFNDKILGR